MSEPRRLRDEGPDDVRDLLRAAPRTRGMTKDERARTAARVTRYASAAAVAAALSWLPGAALGAGIGVATIAVVWGVPALVTTTSLAIAPKAIATVARIAPVTAPPREPDPTPSATPETDRPALRSPVFASAAVPSVTASVAADPPADRLADEVALLERARAVVRSAPSEALAITDEHAARFAHGKLALEREILAIDALRALGRTSEARARAEAILDRVRDSPFEERIRKLVEDAR